MSGRDASEALVFEPEDGTIVVTASGVRFVRAGMLWLHLRDPLAGFGASLTVAWSALTGRVWFERVIPGSPAEAALTAAQAGPAPVAELTEAQELVVCDADLRARSELALSWANELRVGTGKS